MGILSIIAGVTIALIGAGPIAPAGDVESRSPIRVLSHTHEVRFPDRVVFNLEAESETPITAVQLFYTLSGGDVRVYGYPDFSADTRIKTEFTVKTSGTSYVPTGVNIGYHYVITDADGNTFETERYTLEYRDPQYLWTELRRGDLVVLYHDLSLERVDEVVADVDARLGVIKELFGLDEVAPLKAVIVNNRREAQRSFPYTSDAATRNHIFGGFAFGDYGLFVMQGLKPDTMVHESTHLLLDQAVDSTLARVPAWLNEGLAMQFESDFRGRERLVERAARLNGLLRLRNMGSVPGRPSDVGMFYAQAWSVVDYMVDAHGAQRMSALLAAINDGQKIEDAVPTAYGLTLEQLEARWKAQVLGETTIAARPDPGTVGTSALISGAVFLAVIASTWRWLWRWLRGPLPEREADASAS